MELKDLERVDKKCMFRAYDKWPEIAFTWLELENGGHGIFMLDKDQCELFKQLYG